MASIEVRLGKNRLTFRTGRDSGGPTFSEYARHVIALKEREGKKHNTLILYQRLAANLDPEIGQYRLNRLTPDILDGLYERLSHRASAQTGYALSPATVRQYHSFISTVLQRAMKEQLVTLNAAVLASPPPPTKREAAHLQPCDVERLLRAMEHEPIKWLVLTQLFIVTGARRGELAGLRWGAVDMCQGLIEIKSGLYYAPDLGVYEGDTKNLSSRRFISLPAETSALLKDYQQQQTQAGHPTGTSDFVFPSRNGGPMNPTCITTYFHRLSTRHQLPHLHPHVFRHTMASVLIAGGIDVVSVSKRLGHATVTTTLDVYSHQIQKADARAACCIADILLQHGTPA